MIKKLDYCLNENQSIQNESIKNYLQLRKQLPFIVFRHSTSYYCKIIEKLPFIAKTNEPVLLLGQTGTGKDVIAEAIHILSGRTGQFLKIDLNMLNENLIETTIFGHEAGAYTGALKRNIGKFEQGNKGTFFLDEIGNISLEMQKKLLKFLQDRKFERVGGNATINVDVRIITATNINIDEAIKYGKFRPDLYYRMGTIPLILPPLKERKEEIPDLIKFFINQFNDEYGRNVSISDELVGILKNYDWPGNIRELRNEIRRLSILSKNSNIELSDVPFRIKRDSDDLIMNGRVLIQHNDHKQIIQIENLKEYFKSYSIEGCDPMVACRLWELIQGKLKIKDARLYEKVKYKIEFWKDLLNREVKDRNLNRYFPHQYWANIINQSREKDGKTQGVITELKSLKKTFKYSLDFVYGIILCGVISTIPSINRLKSYTYKHIRDKLSIHFNLKIRDRTRDFERILNHYLGFEIKEFKSIIRNIDT